MNSHPAEAALLCRDGMHDGLLSGFCFRAEATGRILRGDLSTPHFQRGRMSPVAMKRS
jgi:hypothetical protein